ncbi:NAD kinase [Buchananella hordeovulneris]|uniref:NAD kinase n=1 Tax=Buchananella hordeovulneris TaxID=52770 RepID=A0A1Q5PXD1_9ACTO|nr:NAD kinase [Buchananella hordeovulneris]
MRRRVRVIHHRRRLESRVAAERVRGELRRHGMEPVGPDAPGEVEITVVLGGDGTILSAVEQGRGDQVPIIGINTGHVGFLAEADPEDLSTVVGRIAARDYTVEERMTLDVTVTHLDGTLTHGWALNEAALEKTLRGSMVDVTIGVDGRAMSSFGCDGLVMSTPTGSTAYAFSGGGPVVWPDVEAMLLVPIAGHALFTRPLVVGPSSVLEVEVTGRSTCAAELCFDGRRRCVVPRGAHISVRKGSQPVRLARINDTPFSGRLVAKFQLPVQGWRAGD